MKKLSVIIPAHNAARYLQECLAAVHKEGAFSGCSFEVVVVDDGSADETATVAAAMGCRVIRQAQAGAAAARNTGLRAAAGGFILFVDADDILEDGAIKALLGRLLEDASLAAVFAKATDFVSPELVAEHKNGLRPRIEAYSGVLPGCSIIRRAVFDRVGCFNETLETGETVDWQLRMKDAGEKFANLDRVTLRRRLHPASTGATRKGQERRDYLEILRQRLRRP